MQIFTAQLVFPQLFAAVTAVTKDETNKQFAVPGEGPVVKIVVEEWPKCTAQCPGMSGARHWDLLKMMPEMTMWKLLGDVQVLDSLP